MNETAQERRSRRSGGRDARRQLRSNNTANVTPFIIRQLEPFDILSDESTEIIENNAEIIHAHTPYRVGLPALKAARKLRLPFVYEMRGMWEETAVANGRWKRNGLAYSRFRRFENRILKSTERIISISKESSI